MVKPKAEVYEADYHSSGPTASSIVIDGSVETKRLLEGKYDEELIELLLECLDLFVVNLLQEQNRTASISGFKANERLNRRIDKIRENQYAIGSSSHCLITMWNSLNEETAKAVAIYLWQRKQTERSRPYRDVKTYLSVITAWLASDRLPSDVTS